MAQSFLVTNIQTGNFEDLVNYIWRVSFEQAPFANAIGSVKAKAINHEWMTQALRAAATNEQAEGFTPTFAAGNQTARVRRTNRVQIIADEYSVSHTQEFVDKAGLGQSSEYDEQANLREIEILKDQDFELLRSVAVARNADDAVAGEMDGALEWAPAAHRIAVSTGASLTQDVFERLSRLIWTTSGQTADLAVVAGFNRRQMSTWTFPYKQHESKDTTFVDTVEVYRGDWGSQVILPDPHITESSLLLCRKEYLKKAYLRPLAHYEIGQTIDGRRGYVVTEVTLEARNPNTIGRITGLTTS